MSAKVPGRSVADSTVPRLRAPRDPARLSPFRVKIACDLCAVAILLTVVVLCAVVVLAR